MSEVILDEEPPSCLRRIIKRERIKDEDLTPLAFVIDDAIPGGGSSLTVVRWSEAASARLKSLRGVIKGQVPKSDLPVVSLRGRLELADQLNLRLDRDLGTDYDRTLMWTLAEAGLSRDAVNAAVMGWLVDDLAAAGLSEEAVQHVEQLKKMARAKEAVEVSTRVTDPFKWGKNSRNTAKDLSKTSYADLADDIACQLEAQAIFPNLPGLRRIAGGQLT